LCFLPESPTPEHAIAHNDGNAGNAAASNLRWATALENKADERQHGTNPAGERNPRAILTSGQVREIRDAERAYGSRSVLAKKFGVSRRAIDKIRGGVTWKHI
jgi:hypothetical protein